MNQELPDVQAGFRKAEEQEIKLPTWSSWVIEKVRECLKNIYFCFIDYTKALTLWITMNWKILKEMGIPDHLSCLLRNLYASRKATVRTGHGTTDWYPSGKEYVKAVYCHPAYLTDMQSTSWETLDWKKHKLDSRYKCTGIVFILLSSRYVSKEQSCFKTTGLYD